MLVGADLLLVEAVKDALLTEEEIIYKHRRDRRARTRTITAIIASMYLMVNVTLTKHVFRF